MYKSGNYKVTKQGNTWFVLNINDDAHMAKVNCLYRAKTLLECRNWIRKKNAWFKSDLVKGKDIIDSKGYRMRRIERLLKLKEEGKLDN